MNTSNGANILTESDIKCANAVFGFIHTCTFKQCTAGAGGVDCEVDHRLIFTRNCYHVHEKVNLYLTMFLSKRDKNPTLGLNTL